MFTKKDILELVSSFGLESTIRKIVDMIEDNIPISIDGKECKSEEEIRERLEELGYQ